MKEDNLIRDVLRDMLKRLKTSTITEQCCDTCKYEALGETENPCIKCYGDINYWEPKPDTPTTRADFLKIAEGIVCHDRNDKHGEPEDNFGIIAKLWSVYLNSEIKSADVTVMMCLFKIARMRSGKMDNPDSWTDLIGYAACGAECAVKGHKADEIH